MLLWPIASESVGSNLELLCPIAEAHEAQYPEQDAYCFCTDVFDCSHIHSLTVVSQPVPKVDTFDVELAELLAASGTGHENVEQCVFNISMAPVLPFNFGNRSLRVSVISPENPTLSLPIFPAPKAATGEDNTAMRRTHESTNVREGVYEGILTAG